VKRADLWARLGELADIRLLDSATIVGLDGEPILELEPIGIVAYRIAVGDWAVVIPIPAELAGSRAAHYVVARRVIDHARDAGPELEPFLEQLAA
jgi:hypothetical protein